MKDKEVKALSGHDLRLKVAALLGITDIHETDGAICLIEDIGTFYGKRRGVPVDVPDFPNDLNACQEFAGVLRKMEGSEWFDFETCLMEEYGNLCNALFASARSKCEAFVLAMEWRKT